MDGGGLGDGIWVADSQGWAAGDPGESGKSGARGLVLSWLRSWLHLSPR